MDIVLRGFEGMFIGFKKKHNPELWIANREGDNERFSLEEHSDGLVSIVNMVDGEKQYLGFLKNHDPEFWVSETCSSNEKFTITKEQYGAIQLSNGNYFLKIQPGVGFHKPKLVLSSQKDDVYTKFTTLTRSKTARWMTDIYEKIKHTSLGNLTMPGGHNSAMNYKDLNTMITYLPFVNQYWSIDEQYEEGCRYFELRLYHRKGSSYYSGFHKGDCAVAEGTTLVSSNAKYQLQELNKKLASKDLIILDLERSCDVPHFNRDMKDIFKNKIINPSELVNRFGNKKLHEYTIEQLVSCGNVILLNRKDDKSNIGFWERETELKWSFKDKKDVPELVEALKEDVFNNESFKSYIWIHDAYVTSSFGHLIIRDIASQADPQLIRKFIDWKSTGKRINVVKLDFYGSYETQLIIEWLLKDYENKEEI